MIEAGMTANPKPASEAGAAATSVTESAIRTLGLERAGIAALEAAIHDRAPRGTGGWPGQARP